MSTENTIDLLFSFDTTGSMRPAIRQVRQKLEATVRFLLSQIPTIRIGIIAHGDYVDGKKGLSMLDFTNDLKKLVKFVQEAPDTSGGDSDEFYEVVLHEARSFSWTSGTNKALVMIGDAEPHKKGTYSGGQEVIYDWRNELGLLIEAGVTVYPVQALAHYGSGAFYKAIAQASSTPHLKLEQFEDVTDLIAGLAFKRAGRLDEFETYLGSRITPGTSQLIANLSGKVFKRKRASVGDLRPVEPSRFQVLSVRRDVPIKDFVLDNGLAFKTGRGFYEFKKPVLVQDYKEVIVQDIDSGEMFTGDAARNLLGIPVGRTAKVRPESLVKWRGFIQSTSPNRKLLSGTKFLYEADRF